MGEINRSMLSTNLFHRFGQVFISELQPISSLPGLSCSRRIRCSLLGCGGKAASKKHTKKDMTNLVSILRDLRADKRIT